MLGRIIDELPNEAKTQLVRDQKWTTGAYYDDDGNRCFYGQLMPIVSKWRIDTPDWFRQTMRRIGVWNDKMRTVTHPRATPGWFDRLCQRFGKDRIVRLIKQRAGESLDLDEAKTVEHPAEREQETAAAVG